MSKYTIGIDLGGTTMTAGLVNEKFEVVGKVTWATSLPRPAQDLEKALAELCRTVARENKVDFADIRYVGIGTPGSVNFTTGFVGFNTNFGYYDWNLGPDMEKLLGCKVYVENDANAAAFGEYIAGGAKGYRDAVIITLGTGIGSGIILNGKILRGFNFAAGEMGHNVIVKDGIQCTCGALCLRQRPDPRDQEGHAGKQEHHHVADDAGHRPCQCQAGLRCRRQGGRDCAEGRGQLDRVCGRWHCQCHQHL